MPCKILISVKKDIRITAIALQDIGVDMYLKVRVSSPCRLYMLYESCATGVTNVQPGSFLDIAPFTNGWDAAICCD